MSSLHKWNGIIHPPSMLSELCQGWRRSWNITSLSYPLNLFYYFESFSRRKPRQQKLLTSPHVWSIFFSFCLSSFPGSPRDSWIKTKMNVCDDLENILWEFPVDSFPSANVCNLGDGRRRRSKNIFAGFIYLKWESIRSPRTTLSSGTSLLGSLFPFMCRLAYLARGDKALSHDFSDNQIAFWSTSPPNQFLFGLGLGARVRFASSSSSRLDFSLIAHIGFYE